MKLIFSAVFFAGFATVSAALANPLPKPKPKGPPPTACKVPAASAQAKVDWDAMECFSAAKDFKSAAVVGEMLIKNDPLSLKAYIFTSWFYWSQSQLEVGNKETEIAARALDWLNKAVEKFPTSWQARMERGDFYFLRLKELDLAYADYLKAREFYEPASERHRQSRSRNGWQKGFDRRPHCARYRKARPQGRVG